MESSSPSSRQTWRANFPLAIALSVGSCMATPSANSQVPVELPQEKFELNFGKHTDPRGMQSWNVGLVVLANQHKNYSALADTETVFLSLADQHIASLLHSECLTQEQIGKLRLAAKVDAHKLVRSGELLLYQVKKYPVNGEKSEPEMQALVSRFRSDHVGPLFGQDSLYAKLLESLLSQEP